MPIIYSLVARGTTILAEYAASTGNFTQITRHILEKLPQANGKTAYNYDNYTFLCLIDDGLLHLCMTEQEFEKRIALSFLEDIKNRFHATYGDRGRVAVAYGMNADFSRVLQKQMEFYSTNAPDKLRDARAEVEQVRSIMVQNIEKVLDRGDHIELLVDKTQTLSEHSLQFKKSSTTLKRVMWWKNVKLMIIIAVVAIVLLYFLICIICGGLAWQGCVHKK
eukprot:m51a1_g2764 putative Synaptobrevin (221) ;mRNA; r:990693-991847